MEDAQRLERLPLRRGERLGQPAPAGRIDLLIARFEQGLDLWTGLPLQGKALVENHVARNTYDDETPERVAPSDNAIAAFAAFAGKKRRG